MSNDEKQLSWYKLKLKEQLQINSGNSHRLKNLEEKLERADKYNADKYPIYIAYPAKFLMTCYRCGAGNTIKHFSSKFQKSHK